MSEIKYVKGMAQTRVDFPTYGGTGMVASSSTFRPHLGKVIILGKLQPPQV